MSDGLENITAVGLLAATAAPISRVSKGSTVIASTATNAAVALPGFPFINRDYKIVVGVTVAPVLLFPPNGSTGNTTATINGLAAGVSLSLPPNSTAIARCVAKNYASGNTWVVNITPIVAAGSTVVLPAATPVTLTSANSGAIHIINTTAPYAINLPPVAVGGVYYFKKIVAGAVITTIASGGAGLMTGNILSIATATPIQEAAGPSANVLFTAASLGGSWITVYGNGFGTGWYVEGVGFTAGAGAALDFT